MKSDQGYARKALVASIAGYATDGFDMLILAFMLPAITKGLNLTSVQAGSLVSWTLFGALLGGISFGYLSDRFGRIRMLRWSILLFAIATGLCALVRGYWGLVTFRTICGLGLGGEFGIGMALVAETWPAAMRARVSSYVALGWQSGVLLAALVTPLLLPIIGWRGMFALGAVPALVAFVMRRFSREPEIFVERAAEGRAEVPWKLLVKDVATAKVSVGIFVLCAIQNFGYYGLMTWLPTNLAKRLNISLTQSSIWAIATIAGMACGIWVFGQLADRVGRRPSFLLFQLGAAVTVVVFSRVTGHVQLIVAGAAMGVFVNGMLGGYGALISELYPTDVRVTAQNTLFNLGRAVGGLGPVAMGALAARYSIGAAAVVLACIYLVDMAATAGLIPETRGRALQ